MSDSLRPRRVRASYSMDFKLELVEKSYQPGACVAQLAREHGINDNLLFTWRQRYSCQQRVKSDPLTATTNGLILIHLVYSGLASAITPAFRFCFSR
ncbi:TPA: transposase [Klebsiella pneumoniae]|nr:transposase [Klebsiella pneumoniae]HBW7283640.1 transposase [Klebsiella pneumoniae]HBW8673393.1 transposase [Klebsiella pneumoniae]HBW8706695.1 transposase [Klebsiella pneumoniae]